MKKHNRFEAGSGVYTCRSCGRNTRSTGDGGDVRLCEPCYELAGWQNAFDDGQDDLPLAEIVALADLVRSKGGKVSWAFSEVLEFAKRKLAEAA